MPNFEKSTKITQNIGNINLLNYLRSTHFLVRCSQKSKLKYRLPNRSITKLKDCYKITSLSPFSGKTNARNFQLKFPNKFPTTLTATFYFTSEINSHGILNDGWMEGSIIVAIN
jgi:hypothetical protein